MSQSHSESLRRLIATEMAAGHYSSESELLTVALRALREIRSGHEKLRQEIRKRMAKAGQGEPLDFEAFRFEARMLLAQRTSAS